MRARMKWIVVAVGALLLTGCKTEVFTHITLSDLANPEVTEVPGTALLEVDSCTDYKDSRQPSDSLVKVQQMLPQVFPQAEFVGCYPQSSYSWAQFSIPIAIDHGTDRSIANEEVINLLTDTAEGYELYLGVPAALSQQIRNVVADPYVLIYDLELSMKIGIENDTGEEQKVVLMGVWVDDDPMVDDVITILPGGNISLSLSDVSIDYARVKEIAPIMWQEP